MPVKKVVVPPHPFVDPLAEARALREQTEKAAWYPEQWCHWTSPYTHIPKLGFQEQWYLGQAAALRAWIGAPKETWVHHSELLVDAHRAWAQAVPPEVNQAWCQDMLCRSLETPHAEWALPLLVRMGARLLEGHPDGHPNHHPLSLVLQKGDAKVLGKIASALLPSKPFENGQDPFPSWSRANALEAMYVTSFGEAGHQMAQGLGLIPSPDEQATVMQAWLAQQQHKRCTVAWEKWGWTPANTAALHDGWWQGRLAMENPGTISKFDQQWAERFPVLPFSPSVREIVDAKGAKTLGSLYQVQTEVQRWDAILQRSVAWTTLWPLLEVHQHQLSAELPRVENTLVHAKITGDLSFAGQDLLAEKEKLQAAHLNNVQRFDLLISSTLNTPAPLPSVPRPRI